MRKLVLVVLLGVAGCSGGGQSFRFVEVQGKGLLGGRPGNRVMMTFTRVEEGVDSNVCVVENGQYKNQVFARRYKISFEPAPGGSPIPAKYRRPNTSGLEMDVASTKEMDFDLKT